MMHAYVIAAGLFMTITLGETVKCYHCYDSFQNTKNMGNSSEIGQEFGSLFVRCHKNKLQWNTWDCPLKWPVCVIMSGTVRDHHEVIRTCAIKNFCSSHVPPNDVKMDSCRECNTTLCNDYPSLPDPPINPGPLFYFNININLNLKKYPI